MRPSPSSTCSFLLSSLFPIRYRRTKYSALGSLYTLPLLLFPADGFFVFIDYIRLARPSSATSTGFGPLGQCLMVAASLDPQLALLSQVHRIQRDLCVRVWGGWPLRLRYCWLISSFAHLKHAV
ncbi:hypothetical protein RRG08_036123 [Elysia crispata]|uniref:Uncharacterized protein n=1 Tax=Elysia crispata TaxID=231223 RepID=A0AAE1AL06_9GAST|nr:hypothetical protein RRG08_036123 [Elysia crispata]